MININKKQIIIIITSIIAIILTIIGIIYYKSNEEIIYIEENNRFEINNQKNETTCESLNEEIKQNDSQTEIVVHVTGQVQNSGIVKLKESSRIIDAIEAAGGITQDADLNKVNLAYILVDGQKIYIPSKKDKQEVEYIVQDSSKQMSINEKQSATTATIQTKININTANVSQLTAIPGIGEATAQKIIAYRQENGKFKTIEDIKNVSGIGNAKFNNIKNYIKVN